MAVGPDSAEKRERSGVSSSRNGAAPFEFLTHLEPLRIPIPPQFDREGVRVSLDQKQCIWPKRSSEEAVPCPS